jgi:nucleotide-binding universal stress UspA family protein
VAWLDRAGWLVGSRVTVLGLLGERAGFEQEAPETADELARLVGSDPIATLEQLARPLAGDDVAVDYIVRGGHPLQATLDATAEFGADLVAVARSQHHQARDPISEKVARHSAASVLLVPQA